MRKDEKQQGIRPQRWRNNTFDRFLCEVKYLKCGQILTPM
jgi:hypothetical protein